MPGSCSQPRTVCRHLGEWAALGNAQGRVAVFAPKVVSVDRKPSFVRVARQQGVANTERTRDVTFASLNSVSRSISNVFFPEFMNQAVSLEKRFDLSISVRVI